MKRLTSAAGDICEACGPSPFCIHVDGNHKLYRYKTSDNNLRPYHAGTVIQEPAEVDAHLRKLDGIRSVSEAYKSLWFKAIIHV